LDGNAPLKEHEKKPDALGQLGLTRSDLGIYTLIVFGLVFFILSKFAWKPIVEGLDKREALILSAKEEAEKSLAETQKLRAELEASRHKGAEEVKAMIDEARRDAEALREKLKADATAEIATERDRLRREIESAKDQALTEIWGKAVQLATLISTKTVKKQLTEDDHRKLVDESLSELKSSLNKAG
jgi:F-type H+-transporting ATPase subunit b